MPRTHIERQLAGSYGGHKSWANTPDVERTERTRKPREAFEARFLRKANGDPKRAESLRKAYFAELALKSVQARRKRGGVDDGAA